MEKWTKVSMQKRSIQDEEPEYEVAWDKPCKRNVRRSESERLKSQKQEEITRFHQQIASIEEEIDKIDADLVKLDELESEA